jgi:hypothetical protein
METHTPARHCLAALVMCCVVGLVGCDSVYTIHSIEAPSSEPSVVPDLSGVWAPSDATSTSALLRIAANDFDNGHCRNADIRSLGSSSQEWDQPFGDQVCFVPTKLAEACDEDDEDHPRWVTYSRMTPSRQPDVDGAVDSLPAPKT